MNMTEISQKKIILIGRVTSPDYQTTARDVAEAQELVNQYIDALERLENTASIRPAGVTVEVDGKVIEFTSDKDFTNWLAGRVQ